MVAHRFLLSKRRSGPFPAGAFVSEAWRLTERQARAGGFPAAFVRSLHSSLRFSAQVFPCCC
jgi:hypothetical protein